MARYRTFGILLRFQFQITAAATCTVRQLRIAQNHALSARLHNFFHHRTRFFNIFDRRLFDNDNVRRIFFQTAFQYGQPLVKVPLCFRQVENVQLDAAPISVGRTCGGGNPLKLPARTVKLAIQRIGRKIAGKPRRRREGITLAADQLFAVPIGAYAVQFLAGRPALHVLVAIFFRQHQRRRGPSRGGYGKKHTKNRVFHDCFAQVIGLVGIITYNSLS